LSVRISNQKFKKTICFNKSKSTTKTIIAESNITATRKLFVVINSRKLLNKKYSNFDNKFLIKNKLETNTNFIFDNFEINYKTFLEKKKKNRNSLLLNISINFF